MRTVLDNGLTVVIEPDHRSKVVALQLWVQVGSADEAPDEAGLAHLHEHMLFKGTERRGPGDLAREVEACGGDVNAWTSFDETVYHLVLSSAFWREGLELLADAASNSQFDAVELARESEVVCEEIRRNEDSPSRQLSRLMFSTAFGTHPYGRPVIGSEASVRAFTREKVLAFYRRHYTAGRMTLVIAGDVDADAALRAAKACFASLRSGVEPRPHTRLSEPTQTATRAAVKVAQLQEGRLSLAFRGPELRHGDAPALDLLAIILAQGNASRLEHRLRLDLALVNGVTASAYTPMDPGLFTVTAALPMANIHQTLAVIGEEVERLRREPVSEDELARAKRSLDVSFVHQRETVEGIARQHGYDQLFFGGPEAADAYHQRACDSTPADLLAAARRWLDREQLTVAALVDEAAGVSESSLLEVVRAWPGSGSSALADAEQHPYRRLSHTSADASEPRIHKETLPGGVTLVVRPERATPMVSLRAAWQGGLRLETPANVGAHQLLSRSLTRGTRRHDARRFSEEVDALGATVGGEAGRNSYGVRTDLLAVDLERGLDLFTDLLFHPTLDEAGVGGERTIQLEEVRSRDDNPSRAAFLLFAQKLFGSHPYAMDALGTPDSLATLTGPALKSYFESSYGLEGLVIAVAGDVDPDRLRDLLAARLADVPRRPLVARTPPGTHRLEAPVEAVRKLDRKQAHLVVGFRGISLLDDDRHALSVLQTILGGQGGRLFAELREKQSLCYSVAPTVNEGLDPGHFGVYIGTSPDKVAAARQGIREQLERIVQAPVTEDELHRARRQLVGGHDIGLQQLHARAAVMALEECYGLGAEAHLTATEKVLAVTREDVLRVARRLVDFDRCVTALVTPDA